MTSYAEFAAFYDQINGDRSEDVGRIRDYVRRFRPQAASLLELGCGTGMVLAGLADYLTVAGVDLSPRMLERAAVNVPQARLVEGDITDFDLGTRYDVVICVFDTLNHVRSFEAWRRLFGRVHEHLADGGIFAFDVNTTGRLRGLERGPGFAEDFGSNTVVMDVSPGTSGLSMWQVRIFERLDDGSNGIDANETGAGGAGGELFRLHREVIPELGVPLEQVRSALADGFELLEQTALGGGPVDDDAPRAYFVYRRR